MNSAHRANLVSELRPDGNRIRYDVADVEPFVDPATGLSPHYIEESVNVYLRLDDKGQKWIVDSQALDYALESDYEDGPLNQGCPCSSEGACEAIRQHAAANVELPDAEELMIMLAEALQYSVKRIGQGWELTKAGSANA